MRLFVSMVCLFFGTFLWAANETQLHLYRPFMKENALPSIEISQSVLGACRGQSERMPRKDAWRCVTHTETYDPCFKKPAHGSKQPFFCPQTPWTGVAVQVNANAVVSNVDFVSIDMAKGKPWAIELQNGQRCLSIEEQTVLDQQPISFVCQGEQYLLGQLRRCRAQWSILWSDGKQIEERYVKAVWF